MRRAHLLAALAVPAIAAADIPAPAGQLLDFINFSAAPTQQASFVNNAMCLGQATLQLEWNLGTQPTQTGTYTLYASNKAPPTSGTDINFCAIQDDTNTSTKAGPITGGTGLPQQNAVQRNTAVTGVNAVSKAGFTCGSASEGQVFYICAHFSVGTTRTASAFGKFVVQVLAPGAPTLNSVGSGNGRITASWTPPTTGTTADHYVVEATPVGGGTTVFSSNATGTSADVTGLQNDTTYSVIVRAFSIGGNPSGPSNALEESPKPTAAFWDVYQARGGTDEGGCASGSAGALALLGAASLLALRRRRS